MQNYFQSQKSTESLGFFSIEEYKKGSPSFILNVFYLVKVCPVFDLPNQKEQNFKHTNKFGDEAKLIHPITFSENSNYEWENLLKV